MRSRRPRRRPLRGRPAPRRTRTDPSRRHALQRDDGAIAGFASPVTDPAPPCRAGRAVPRLGWRRISGPEAGGARRPALPIAVRMTPQAFGTEAFRDPRRTTRPAPWASLG